MITDLSEEDFLAILTAAESIDGVVIGGQALNLWADALLSPDDYDSLGPFTSKDIDFWGNQKAAEDLAQALAGKIILPEPWDTTPSSAAVCVTLSGKDHQIDFLRIVCGLDTNAFIARAQQLETSDVQVAVLHPLDVLKSRIAGVRILRRTDMGALRQLRSAPIIVARYIESLLDQGSMSEAQDVVRELIMIGGGAECDPLFRDHDFDALASLSDLTERPEWHPLFLQYQIKDPLERARSSRMRRLTEMSRRSEGRAS